MTSFGFKHVTSQGIDNLFDDFMNAGTAGIVWDYGNESYVDALMCQEDYQQPPIDTPEQLATFHEIHDELSIAKAICIMMYVTGSRAMYQCWEHHYVSTSVPCHCGKGQGIEGWEG